jgi:thiol-disulfide isomerase/thioredoxin
MKKLPLLFFVFALLAAPAFAMDGGMVSRSLTLQDLSGQSVDMLKFTQSSKKPLLLFFWTSWCPYCMQEVKTIDQRQKELGDSVDLFAINAGEGRGIVERVAKSNNFNVRVFLDESTQAAETFGIIGVPAFVLIDRQGKVVFNGNSFPNAEIRVLQKE